MQHSGYNCTGGELSGLFVTDLGDKACESVINQAGNTAEQIATVALFSNVRFTDYWSITEVAPTPRHPWCCGSSSGLQNYFRGEIAL